MDCKTRKVIAPFGVETKRFNRVGFHPKLDVSGALKKEITKTGPGSYNPKKSLCASKLGLSWKRKFEVEEFSKFLGFRNAKFLQARAFQKTLGGPGFSDVKYDFSKKQNFSTFQNTGFGIGERFTKVSDDNPPIGTYSKNMDKSSILVPKPGTKRPHFEWDGFIERFKDKTPTYTKPPNLYNPIDRGSLEAVLNKVVSLRGPYDLFTGLRDNSTIKNHFATRTYKIPEYVYVPLSDLDVMLKYKKRYGMFLKSQKFPKRPTIKSMLEDISLCYKDPSEPGPAHYHLDHVNSITKKNDSMYGFNSSNINARPPTNWEIKPGVGRYNPRQLKCSKLKRPSWVFLVKAKRKFFDSPRSYAAF